MPIEIRELVIKANLEEAQPSLGTSTSNAPATGANNEALVNLCVEKVLEILKEKQER